MSVPTNSSLPVKILYSIDNKLKSGFNSLCCKLSNNTSIVPVYEYVDVQAPSLTGNHTDDIYYTISSTNLTLASKGTVALANLCGDFEDYSDSVSNMKYEDSLGNYAYFYQGTSSITIPYASFISKEFYAIVTIYLNSGFIYSYRLNMLTSAGGVPSVVESFVLTSNSNSSSQNLWVNTLAFQKPLADALEVWEDGSFSGYVDINTHLPFTPHYCLSYDPVQPFKTFDEERVTPIYNNVRHLYLGNNQSTTIPADSAHEISFHVLGGACSVSINAVSVTLPVTAKDTITATTLINYEVIVTAPAGVANLVYVKIIEP
jgi:hypothetical protein